MSTTEGRGRGFFITLEGPDGSGKSTQLGFLVQRLRKEGYDVVESAEPGGTPIGLQIRRIVLDSANQELSAKAELLLMFAARAQNVEQLILPALAQGKIVVSDRFTDSTLAYQGAARGLGSELVLQVHTIACNGLFPDLTLCIDIDTATGLARAHNRNRSRGGVDESRLDQQAVEFHRKVRHAYFELARSEPQRVKIVDGNAEPEAIAQALWSEVARAFNLCGVAR